MKIKTKYFGVIAEITGKSDEEFEISEGTTVKEFDIILRSSYEFKNLDYQIALNQVLVEETQVIESLSELALLPPFAGG